MPHSIFTGRAMPAPGEPLFLLEDTELVVALVAEERDTCQSCGMPKAWCRKSEDGRQRWGIEEDFCWATFRLSQRKPKTNQDGSPSAVERATIVRPAFREGYELGLLDGLDLDTAPEPDDDTDPAETPTDES